MRQKRLLNLLIGAIFAIASTGILQAQTTVCPQGLQPYLYTKDAGGSQHITGCLNPSTGNYWIAGELADSGGQVTNVLTLGAKGDGSTDDTAAIQKAIHNTPSGGTIYFPRGDYPISAEITLTKHSLDFAPGSSLIINAGGGLTLGTRSVLKMAGSTITVKKTSGSAVRFTSGWAHAEVSSLKGPNSGMGNGATLMGAQFCYAWFGEITGFRDVGLEFNGRARDGAAQDTVDNTVFIQHIYGNTGGVLWRNESAPGDFLDEDNHVYGGLVNSNSLFEVKFGDSGTHYRCQDNFFTGFADSTKSGHPALVFENSSYNQFDGQIAGATIPNIQFISSPWNYILSPSAPDSAFSGVSQEMIFTAARLAFGGLSVTYGRKAPQSSCSPNGSLYVNQQGGTGSTLYVCESAAWAAK